MVNRILCTWIVLVQVLLWSGLALRVHEFGWHPYWATELLAGVQLYMLAPLLTPGKGIWRRAPKARTRHDSHGLPRRTGLPRTG